MSFILDALKKSENERQQQVPAEFSTVPSDPGAPGAPRWLWILGILLALNVAVVLGFLLRPEPSARALEPLADTPLHDTPIAAPAPTPTAATERLSFSERVAEARMNQPELAAPSPAQDHTAAPAPEPVSVARPPARTASVTETGPLPTLTELRVNGGIDLPDLHLDLHKYDNNAAERMVFINGAKHREGSRLSEGSVIQEITLDGVILEHQGSRFLLTQD